MQEELSFGVWLRKKRRNLDLSRQAFAAQVGCAEVTLRRIETGTLKPSKELARILLEMLDIPKSEWDQWISFARGSGSFPKQKAVPHINRPVTNLPAALTSFIGREKEQADVIRLLGNHRLITLTGSGGVGKTRLSFRVGEQVLTNYADGVWLVELAFLNDPLLVPRMTAIAIGLRDEPQRPVVDMLSDYLREKKVLIIFDNCEHLVDACAQLSHTLLKRCPQLKIMATSREVLDILGEAAYRVPSLTMPDSQQLVEKLRDYESVRLFEERAQLARMDFSLTLENASTVAIICNQLDGIPLAIELAAARVSTFSLEEIAAQLEINLDLLATGNRTALPRHQTLQAAIGWSYNLLSQAEQVLFQRLSVFVDGWTLEAAKSVWLEDSITSNVIFDLLTELIKKSLIVAQENTSKTRFRMLETIRQYAHEKLIEAGEDNAVRDRHLAYFLNLAEAAEPHLIRPEQIDWLPVVEADYENIRLAFEYSLNREPVEVSLRLCTALGWFWIIRCYWLEGLEWVTRALGKPVRATLNSEKTARARALYTRAMLEWQLGKIQEMQISAEVSLVMASENLDKRDVAIAKYFLAAALLQSGEGNDQGRFMLAQSFAEVQELNELFWQAQIFKTLGYYLAPEDQRNSPNLILQSLEYTRRAGERSILADVLGEYADWLFRVGRVNEAREQAKQSDFLHRQVGSEKSNLNPFLLAEIAWNNGDYEQARSIYLELYQRFSMLGEKGFRSNSVGKLGILTMEEGDLEQARIYLEEALLIEREAGWKPWEAFYLIELGNLFYLQGNLEQFKQHVREAFALRRYFPDTHKTYMLMTIIGSLCFKKPDNSARLLGVIHNPERKTDFPRTPADKRYCRRAEKYAREALGEVTYESTFAEGQKLSLDEGLDLALKTVEEL